MMGCNTTYIFIDILTGITLIEFTFMFGDHHPNIGNIVHIRDESWEVKEISHKFFNDDIEDDCKVVIKLEFYCKNHI